MKAVRLYGVGDLRVEDVDPPESPGRDEVRLRITATGICGSDLHNFRTGQWIRRTPSIVGHEIAGVIEDIGSAAADLRPGDRVTVDSRFWCGACSRCLAGNRHLCEGLGFVGEVCDGGCAAAATLPARLVLKVDADVDDRIIAMSEPLAVALHATRRLRIDPGQPVLIVGCGAIGGLASLALSETHDGPIFVADRNSDRAALVAKVTGAIPVSLERDSLRQTIGARPILHGLEATGNAAALRSLLDCVEPGATVAMVGIYHGDGGYDPNCVVEREMSLVGCHAFRDELPEAIRLLQPLAFRLASFIDAEISLDDVPEAYRRLSSGASRKLKTIVRPDL